MKPEDYELEEVEMMTLDLDDGTSLECEIIAYFDVDDVSYIALHPEETPEGFGEDEVLVYRYIELSDDEFTLENIEDDDEMERVSDAFDEILDDAEFNDLFDD